ncbi:MULTISPECIES: TetR/AcrR family transcriptional regulator [unclassified Microbacterium]|uniref:TetR/AcrR family transcriptional regulator n=1 Tax=unclassified Microbacterium TaxID=2609290 RepID=UPI0012FC9A85|nr:TetR family transcriptional regulator C-terminal domain-containing protein [Microbacterium sp. MAH-37]MVQ40556.1 TetR family transcriptional regulator [Microbacterium sp. MAH-37]
MSTAERPRARRKAPQERAAEITAAARSLALESGISAVTLRAVATRAGVTPALVAHYSDGMDRLVADVFQRIVADERREVAALVAVPETATASMDALLDTMIDGTRDDVTLVWVEAWAHGLRNEPLAQAVRSEMDGWRDLIRDVIVRGVDSGEFRTSDPTGAAWQILGMVDGLNAQSLVRWGDSQTRGSMLHAAVAGVLGAS